MSSRVSLASRRRTQAARSRATRGALVASARELFAARGFAGAGAEEIAARAGLSSGAVYHHFRDKRDLFRAAFEAAEADLAARVAGAASVGRDPWSRLRLGVAAYLEACAGAEVRRLVLLDGPSVLGWEEWRARDAAHHLRPLRAALAAAMRAGLLERRPPEPVARLLLGALSEAGLAAAAEGPASHDAVSWLLERLRHGGPSGHAEPPARGSKEGLEEQAGSA